MSHDNSQLHDLTSIALDLSVIERKDAALRQAAEALKIVAEAVTTRTDYAMFSNLADRLIEISKLPTGEQVAVSALKPFVAYMDELNSIRGRVNMNTAADDQTVIGQSDALVTVGDFRRAKEIVEKYS